MNKNMNQKVEIQVHSKIEQINRNLSTKRHKAKLYGKIQILLRQNLKWSKVFSFKEQSMNKNKNILK